MQYASPATVSRCGMVYVDPKNLGYAPFWEKWVNEIPNENDRKELMRLYEKYVPPCISMVLEGIVDGRQGEKLKCIVPLTNLNMVCATHDNLVFSHVIIYATACIIVYLCTYVYKS